MIDDTNETAAAKHTIPVIDRMMDVLGQLERRSNGATIRELTAHLSLPRTTIYRILNTLQGHDMVRRDDNGSYTLGRRLLTLASHVVARVSDIDIAAIGQPFLDRLSAELGEGSKLSVIDQDGILVVAASQGRREYALTVAPGQRMPIHAGAASKLLLAHLPPDELAVWLAKPLIGYTPKSITDPKRLASELVRIKRLGWAQDRGENAPSIHAFAAPVFAKTGRLAAAISVPFLAGAEPSRMEEIRLAAIDAARAMSEAMPV
ncbi:DNA-binding IclR family transcriptional regulator [Rhizobium sp. BK313]|uniref:IclR family transcriptional regulator n=1 Tax=Rhizobium sp. BK313 TaxID=2587081 RepID=UPI001061EB88|nr:IclR family transcriptional regulator [Rhizobium sp. BK313]MBB3456946.1 DNA-binding IclR family transcriptional regulator [Rhizobium sp. BK313]